MKFFTIAELCKSTTADRLGINKYVKINTYQDTLSLYIDVIYCYFT